MLKWFPIWVAPVLLVYAVGTVWLRIEVVRTTYAIGQVERQIKEAQRAKELMQLKVAAFRSPRRLENLAKAKFKLHQPQSEQVIHLKADGDAAPQR